MKHHRPSMGDRFRGLIAYDPLAGLRKKRRRHGGRVNLAAYIGEQAKVVDTAPTDGQKEAGNYRKGHVKVHGLDISIENPRGSHRSGVADGKPWKSRLPHHYGYIRKTEGGDGDHVDVYLGPHVKAPNVYVIDQHDLKSKAWDEHKAFIGFGSAKQAINAYHRAFSDGKGRDRIGHVETMIVDDFKRWLSHADTTRSIKGHRRRYADGGGVSDDGVSTSTLVSEPSIKSPNLLEQARAQYPVLKDQDYGYVENFKPNTGYLEHWDPGDAGVAPNSPTSLDALRPASLPMDKHGLEIRDPSTRPIDVLGDIASHHLRFTDPVVKKSYENLQGSMTPDQQNILQDQYQYAQKNEGETGSFDDWKDRAGMPGFFRGYTFQQWPKEFNDKVYTPEQKSNLDNLMKYLSGASGKASGGRIHMADGGAPPYEPPDAEGPPPYEPPEPDRGALSAAWQGAKSGATFNFNDELAGAHAAGPHLPNVPGTLWAGPIGQTAIGAGRVIYDKLTNRAPEATAAYEHARDEERKAGEIAEAQHPYAHMAGEVAGGLALPIGGGVGAATVPLRIGRGALIGAGTGALYGAGAGEDTSHRLTGAAMGAGTGAVVGAAAPAVVEGALQAASRIIQPIVRTVQGATNTEGEAGRRVITGLQRDFDRQGPSMTPEEIAAANAAGSPRAIIDAGGDTTHALARSSANTSPEARAALTDMVQDRFGTQNDRAAGFVQHLTGATGDNPATVEALQTAARQANRPAYARAYRDGQTVWTPEIEQLTQAPAVQSAIRDATQTGANRAALDGFQPVRNPFEFDATGRMTLRTNPDGSQAVPSLQFWDHVKRNLDDQYNKLTRAGARSEAADVNGLRQSLVGHLDQAVPSYQTARAGAARFFGAQDALEAGSQFVTSRMNNAEAQRAFNRMSAPEQALFRQGYASSLINKIGEMGDRRTILNSIANSPAERQRMEIALGPQNARAMEAFLRAEGVMDRARNAVTGNSTTARQLAELGLAGGAYGIEGLHGGFSDPRAIGTAAVVWGLTHGSNRINERVARRVGEMLASHDPAVLNQGVQLIARNARIFNALRSMDGFSKVAGQHNPFGRFQGPMQARADDEKNKSRGVVQ